MYETITLDNYSSCKYPKIDIVNAWFVSTPRELLSGSNIKKCRYCDDQITEVKSTNEKEIGILGRRMVMYEKRAEYAQSPFS
ncbi:hypothetical protein WN55_06467 [Dufourea novaeangliae]|uniref:Uncharacterized protein n=1 Tax=Dufourea novaeangliae TaxID=178035 RepID=A0A154PQ46_DUFNO|nr:hypothetical protein WN55_06467 [Dufourea novaeangliae]